VNRQRTIAALAGSAAVIVLAYSNHFDGGFHFDDFHTIVQNPFIRDLRNAPRFFTDASTFSVLPTNQSYRPLVTLSLAVDHAVAGGLRSSVFHLQSFCWFLALCGVLFGFFRVALKHDGAALFGATVFGLHPAMADTVNYVIARSDLLSTLGATATVALWAVGGRSRRWQLFLVPALLGVLAKEQGAMAAPLLFLWVGVMDHQRSLTELLRPRHFWAALRPTLPVFVVCGLGALVAIHLAPAWSPGGTSRWHYLATQPWVIGAYLLMFVAPLWLTADTDWGLLPWGDGRMVAGLLVVALVIVFAFAASRVTGTRPVAYGLSWFLLALVPTSSVVPLAEVMNTHRMYFPFVGLAMAAACLALRAVERLTAARRRVALVAGLALLAAGAVGTFRRNQVWHDELTLWRDVTEKSPANGRGWMNYGLALQSQGNYAEAEQAYLRAMERAPGYGYVDINLGILLAATGRHAEAEQRFRQGLVKAPQVPALRAFFARFLLDRDRPQEAEHEAREALRLSAAELDARTVLLTVLADRQARDEVRAQATLAVQLRPDDAQATELLRQLALDPQGGSRLISGNVALERSLQLFQLGQFAESVAAADQALAVHPAWARAHNNRCAALNSLGQFAAAAAACRDALRIEPTFELAQNNLRVALQGNTPHGAVRNSE